MGKTGAIRVSVRARIKGYIDWLTIREQGPSVATDVERIRNHPLVPRDIPIYGYIYQVETGRLVEVPEATRIGKAA